MSAEQEPLDRILNVLKFKSKGMTITEISHVTNTHRNSIAKYLQILLAMGKVDLQIIGNAKVYSLSHRVPVSSILHYSPNLIILLNQDRKIVQVNDTYLKYFQINEKDILNKNICDHTFPIISEDNLLPLINESFKNGEITGKKITYTNDHKPYYFFIKSIPTILEGGECGLIIFIADLTEEKRIRDELTENEEKFNNLFHNLNDSIFFYEITDECRIGKPIDVNDTACKNLYYTRHELLQKEFDDIFISGFQKKNGAITNDLAENTHAAYEGRQKRKDGTIFPVEASAHIFPLQDRQAVLYIVRDTSEKTLAKEALECNEENTRFLLNSINDNSFLVDLNGRILSANKSSYEYMQTFYAGKSPNLKSVSGRSIYEFIPENIGQTISNFASKIITSKKSDLFMDKIENRMFEFSLSPILNSEGEVEKIIVVKRDISETTDHK